MTGSRWSEPSIQPILLASFNKDEIEEAKLDYSDRFDVLHTEECEFMI